MRTRLQIVPWILIVLLITAACTGTTPVLESNAPAVPVTTEGVAEAVAAELETRLPELVATPDAAAIQAAVLAEVQAWLDERLADVEPGVLDARIQEAVAAQLAEPTAIVPIAQNEALATAASQSEIQEALIQLYQRANPAVVFIIVPPMSSGSGFLFDAEGHIVTNNHVVEGGRNFEIVFSNGERSSAELVGSDGDSDLAVLKLEDVPDGVKPLPLANPDSLEVGQFVVAIGNPFGEQGSMSLGIVSGLGRSLRSQRGLRTGNAYSLPQVIQTDAPINPGNSGGPLLNLNGQVVGVNSAIASTTGVNSGVGFSIPVIAVQQIVPRLIEDGRYVYAYMGVGFEDEISLTDQEQFSLDQVLGAYVLNVTPDGPADAAGLVAADPDTGSGGDLIIKIDDVPIRDFADLNSYLVFHATAGQTIELTVLRDGREIVLPLTLGTRP